MTTDAVYEERLDRAWGTRPGFAGFVSAVNHRVIGRRYMITALIFFAIAGIEALVMRLQLAWSGRSLITPEAYNQFFTMHGTTMMFLFVVPFLEGLAIYLVPLMIGARDMAFPRLNAFGYWTYLVAGVVLNVAFLRGEAPNSGWFNYVPLSGAGYGASPNIDYWVSMVTFLEVAALSAAVELIVTIFRQRAPGMTLAKMPLFVWSVLVMAFMIVFAMPALVVASLMLGLDRLVGTHFFDVAAGGHPLLWQHLFWFFGHPDVYIMLVPALGIVATIVPTYARRPLVGHRLSVVALVAIGFISFGLWVHHMFAGGLPILGLNFFAAASMMITIPTAIHLFAYVATIARGRLVPSVAMLYAIGFLVLFILGGITGVMVASVPFDIQVHDTQFVVAHFHYVLIGGVVFPIFAAIHHWFPKISGRLASERAGRWSFWLIFVGFNLTFFPLHVLGLMGMPRRIFAYLPGQGFEPLNLAATVGAFVMGAGVLVVIANLYFSTMFGPVSGDDPWKASTLEWATSSPPPQWNFRVIPVVRSLDPLWDGPDPVSLRDEGELRWREAMAAPATEIRETPATTLLEADPDHRLILPGPSVWPLWLAVACSIAFVGVMVHPLLVVCGLVLSVVALFGWHWSPREGTA
jgi:cytochrome c oxidase subunit 1